MQLNKLNYKSGVFFILFFVMILFLSYIFYFPAIQQNEFRFEMKSGVTVRQLSRMLQAQNRWVCPIVFRVVARVSGADLKLQAGEYYFKKGTSIYSIIHQLKTGDVHQRAFTLVDGWNFNRVMQALNQDENIQHTLQNMTPIEIAETLQMEGISPEGLFLPETYFYTLGSTDLDILKRAHQSMVAYLDQVWPSREENLPYQSPYQALIVASMIEKETAVAEEMPIVSDVIRKRLEQGMSLQMDSTVIYGLLLKCGDKHQVTKIKNFCKDFDGDLKPDDLKIDTLYNTYLHYRLPPTPIAMPSKKAIDAALHPADTEYLYFVAKGDGAHAFSATLEEQNQQIEQLQKRESL